MIYNFDLLPDRRATESYKWHAYDEDVIPMWVADMDFVSPEPVIQALRERVEHGVFGYPKEVAGFRQLIVDRLADLYHWQITPEDVVFVPGVVTGFNVACHALAKPGGEVVVETPVYPPFLKAAEHAEMTRKNVELVYQAYGSYALDWQAFQAAINPQTSLFILCNPHNPVGRVFSRQELECMAEICLRQGVTICSDEIHCDLIYPGHKHIPLASLNPEIAKHTITLMAPSKTYNIAGLECSFAVIQNPSLRRQYVHAQKGLVGWINVMGQVAANAAYREGQEWLDQLLAYLTANRDYLYDFVQAELPGIRMSRPEGTYLAWLDCREAGLDGDPYQFFLDKARVAMNDGKTFGQGGAGFVRLNFGCPRAMLEEALQRMKAALAR